MQATAIEPADLEAIQALVTSLPGQFATLDGTVKQHLHRWVAPLKPAAPGVAVRPHLCACGRSGSAQPLALAAGGAVAGGLRKMAPSNRRGGCHPD